MADFSYNPIAEYVVLKFKCPECGEEVVSDAFAVPIPDFTAETHHDSVNSDWFETSCDNCGKTFEVTLNTGFYGDDSTIERCEIATNVVINRRSYVNDSIIDSFSYAGINLVMNWTKVGKFCSIARNVDIGGGKS